MKLLLDEMLSPRIARELRARGHDVVAVSELQTLRQSPDDQVFNYAQTKSRAVVTMNIQDFRPLGFNTIELGEHHSGIILVSYRRFPGHDPHATGRLITALINLLGSNDELTDTEHWLS